MTTQQPEAIWTAAAEFAVSDRDGTYRLTCAECLPILLRRAYRRPWWPIVLPAHQGICRVRDPHPRPGAGVPYDGYECPRPLTGPCADNTCDHD